MDLPNALQQLARDSNLCAWRERGVAIRMTPNLVIERVFIPRPYRWSPRYGDIIAMDWVTGTPDQFIKFVERMNQAAAS